MKKNKEKTMKEAYELYLSACKSFESKNYEKGKEFSLNALEMYKSVLGNDFNEESADVYLIRGKCYKELGEYEEAKNHMIKALEYYKNTYGDEYIKTQEIYLYIGICLFELGIYEKAQFFFQEVRGLSELNILAGFYNAKCYYHLSKYKEARERFEQIIFKTVIKKQGKKIELGIMAEEIFAETITEGEEKEIEFEITAEEILAECYWYIGLSLYYENKKIKKHINKIIDYINTSLECFQKMQNENIPIANLHRFAGDCYYRYVCEEMDPFGWWKKDLKEAIKCYKNALKIYEKELGKDSGLAGKCNWDIAAAYDYLDDYDEALFWYNEALMIYIKVKGGEDVDVMHLYANISECYYHKNSYEEALSLAEIALVGFEKYKRETKETHVREKETKKIKDKCVEKLNKGDLNDDTQNINLLDVAENALNSFNRGVEIGEGITKAILKIRGK